MLNSEVRDLGLINHINDYCEDISHTHAKFEDSYDTFVTESTYERTIAFDVMQICELTKKLSDEFKSQYDLPWRAISGMRNMIVHDYGHIDAEVLWETSHDDIKQIEGVCNIVLAPYTEDLDPEIDERAPRM